MCRGFSHVSENVLREAREKIDCAWAQSKCACGCISVLVSALGARHAAPVVSGSPVTPPWGLSNSASEKEKLQSSEASSAAGAAA
jgi:hypothetical protein